MPININKRSDVNSVNGKVGDVVLNASDIGALSKDTKIPSKTSDLTNDSNFVVDADYKHTDNNYTTADKNSVATIGNKVDKVIGKGLSTNDLTDELKADYDDAVLQAHTHSNKSILDNITASYTTEEKTKLSSIENNAQKNTVIGVKGEVETDYRVGNVNITKKNIGLGNVANERQWSATNHPTTMSGYGITDGASSTDYNTLKGRVDTNEDNITMLDSDVEGLTTDVGTLKTDMTAVKGAVTTIQGDYVPKTRKVNGKSLSADITLGASDVKAIPTSQKGVANGVAELDANGIIKTSQLPSSIDEIIEADSKSDFPTTGESSKIYIALDTNLTYRWTGTQYVEISPSLALGETSSTAYRGDRGKIAYDHSQKTSGNPHKVTKNDVGLSNVPNVATNDQTPTFTESITLTKLTSGEKLSVAFGKISKAITDLINHIANKNNPHEVTKTQVGLGNVGNFKAVSTVASQGLTDTEKVNARANIGAGTGNSNFSGDYADLSGKPTLGTAASKDVAANGNASTTQVVMGNDTRLTDARKASDVSAWAKASTKPSYTKSEVGLSNVPNVSTNNQTPTFTKADSRDLPISGETLSTLFGKILKWFSDLKTVAFSGSYNDLSNKPTIPSVGNGTITITQNGTTKGTFTMNQNGNTTIALTDTNTDTWRPQPDWNATSGDAVIKNKPSLAKVATSGSYNDLSNKPTIPTIPSSLPANGGNSSAVNGHTVNSDVPANAKFTDTWRDVVDNLSSTRTDASLSANQGRILGAKLPFALGIDADGNYGYYKAGADTVTPFKTGDKIINSRFPNGKSLVGLDSFVLTSNGKTYKQGSTITISENTTKIGDNKVPNGSIRINNKGGKGVSGMAFTPDYIDLTDINFIFTSSVYADTASSSHTGFRMYLTIVDENGNGIELASTGFGFGNTITQGNLCANVYGYSGKYKIGYRAAFPESGYVDIFYFGLS